MKLEPDLIKEILQWCEEKLPDYRNTVTTDDISSDRFTKEQLIYHIELLIEEKYIVGNALATTPHNITNLRASTKSIEQSELEFPVKYSIIHLTMNGHQYLNLLNSKAWNKAKGVMGDIGVIIVEGAINAVIDKVFSSANTK